MSDDQALNLCQQANSYIVKAQNLEDNGPLLAEAGSLYLEATRLDPELAGPYLGLAYITYIAGDRRSAMGLLLRAKTLEPLNLHVAKMLRRFQTKPSLNLHGKKKQIKSLKPSFAGDTLPEASPDPPIQASLPEVLEAAAAIPIAPAPVQPAQARERLRDIVGQHKDAVQSGPQVESLQSALKALGFPLEVNGQFDRHTLKALQSYQFKVKQPVTGCTDAKINQRLNQILDKLEADPKAFNPHPGNHSSPSAGQVATTALPADENPSSLRSDLGPPALKSRVSSGPELRLLQETLDALGFELQATQQFDNATSRAVRAFQTRYKLPLTGWVDDKTRAALNPLIAVSLRRKELLEAMREAIHRYWEAKGHPASQPVDIWSVLLADVLRQIFRQGSGELSVIDFPAPREKPLIDQPLGSMGMGGAISKGPVILRLQELLLAQGLDLSPSGQFDLKTIVALRQFLTAHGLPADESVNPSNQHIFNQLLQATYERESIRDSLLAQIHESYQCVGIPWHRELEHYVRTRLFPLLEKSGLPKITQELGPPGRFGKLSAGSEVAILQALLSKSGLACPLTQNFDAATQQSLKAFQRTHRLPESGMADAATLSVCNEILENIEF